MTELLHGHGAPTAYIDKITLDTSRSSKEKTISSQDPGGAQWSEIVNKELTTNPGLSVSLDLCVKEKVGHDNFFSRHHGLFGDVKVDPNGPPNSFKDYIKVIAIQSTDVEMTQLWKEADVFKYAPFGYSYMIKKLAAYKVSTLNTPANWDNYQKSLYSKQLVEGWAKDLKIGRARNMNLFSISMQDIEENIMQVSGPGSESVYSYRFRLNFDDAHDPDVSYSLAKPEDRERVMTTDTTLPAFTPNHLTYFVISYLDVNSLMRDAGLMSEIDDPPLFDAANENTSIILELASMASQVITKTVFHDKKLNTKSVALFSEASLSSESVYTGPAHQMENGSWMTGQSHSNSSRFLYAVDVFDTRVQDRRASQKFKKYSNNISLRFPAFKSMHDSMMRRVTKGKNYYKWSKEKSYFSDIWLSNDHYDNHMFMFQFDYITAAKDKCIFPEVLSRVPGDIEEYFKIKKIDVIRRRVKEAPAILRGRNDSQRTLEARDSINLFGESGLTPFDRNNPKEDIVVRLLSDASMNVHVPSGSFSKNIIRKVNWNPNSGIYTYTGVDGELKEKGYGNYQYAVEVEIEDGSVRYLQEIYSKLKNHRASLSAYYKFSIMRGNYNRKTNRFNSSGHQLAEFQRYNELAKEAITSMAAYFNVITGQTLESFLSAGSNGIELMFYAVHYSSGSPDGILDVLEMTDQIIEIIESAIGVNVKSKVSHEPDEVTGASGTTRLKNHSIRSFKLKKYFNNDVTSILETMSPGLEFLSTAPVESFKGQATEMANQREREGGQISNTSMGLTAFTAADYINRTRQEVARDFKPDTTFSIDGVDGEDSTERTRYTYLSPNIIRTPGSSPNRAFSVDNFKNNASISAVADILSAQPSNSLSSIPRTAPKLSNVPSNKKMIITDTQREEIMAADSMAGHLANESNVNVTILNQRQSRAPWRNSRAATNVATVAANVEDFFNTSFGTCFSTPKETTLELPVIMLDSALGDIHNEDDANNFMPEVLANLAQSSIFHTKQQMEDSSSRSSVRPLDSFRTFSPVKGLTDLESGIRAPTESERKNLLTSKVQNLPNQIKSLILSAQNKTDALNSSANYFNGSKDAKNNTKDLLEVYFKHQTLVRVEVLSGYMGKSISRPIWVPITSRWMEQITNSDQEFICRLVPYELPEFGVNSSSKLQMPIYNKYFILRPSTFRPPKPLSGLKAEAIISRNASVSRKYEVHGSAIEGAFLRDNLNSVTTQTAAPQATVQRTITNTGVGPRATNTSTYMTGPATGGASDY